MTLVNFDISTDYQVFDALEGVTLRTKRNAGDYIENPITAMRFRVTSKEVVSSQGVYLTQDREWLVPAVNVDTITAEVQSNQYGIKPADQIVDDAGDVWTVLQSTRKAIKSLWELQTRNLVVSFDLRDLITIETPTYTTDAAGGTLKSWGVKTVGTQSYSNLPARVQPTASDIAEERGLRGLRTTYTIPVAQDLSITNDDRVNFNGTYLEIRGYRNQQSIDDLFLIEAELVP